MVGDQRRIRCFGHEAEVWLVRHGPVRRRAADDKPRRRRRIDDPLPAVRLGDVPGLVSRIDKRRTLAVCQALPGERLLRSRAIIQRPMIGDDRVIRRRGREGIRIVARDHPVRRRTFDGRLRRCAHIDDPCALDRIALVARDIPRVDGDRVRPLANPANKVGRRAVRHLDAIRLPVIGHLHVVAGGRRKGEVKAIGDNDLLVRNRQPGKFQVCRLLRIDRPRPVCPGRPIARRVRRIDIYRMLAIPIGNIALESLPGQGADPGRTVKRPVKGIQMHVLGGCGVAILSPVRHGPVRRCAAHDGNGRRRTVVNPAHGIGL